MSKPGAMKEPQAADASVQQIADKFRPELESKEGTKFHSFVAKKYATQIVSASNKNKKIKNQKFLFSFELLCLTNFLPSPPLPSPPLSLLLSY